MEMNETKKNASKHNFAIFLSKIIDQKLFVAINSNPQEKFIKLYN